MQVEVPVDACFLARKVLSVRARNEASELVVVDAIGGVSRVAHEAAMQRMVQAGAHPISVLGLACELQRDWGRPEANRLRAVMREYFGKLKAAKSAA